VSADHNATVATPYAAVYLIFRKDNRFAFVLRANTGWMDGHYALPAGRVERDESFLQAAVREANEEVGVVVQPENFEHRLTIHRKHPDSEWADVVFEAAKWRGELFNAEPDIHGELIWFAADELPDNIVPNSKFIIEKYLAHEAYAEIGWD